jgi:hypothetical protein
VSEAVQPADDASDGTSDDSGAATGAVGTETPPGFVPVTELERERQRAREFQSRYDQLIAEREQMNRSNGDGTTSGQGEDDTTPGFDPDSFRQSVLTDVLRAQQMASGVQQARADFPHADPTLFTPERVAQFGSVESFRFAAQVREELGLQGGGAGGPQGETPAQGGDPTPEQLAAMTMGEWDDLERESPGIIERVLTRAGMQ